MPLISTEIERIIGKIAKLKNIPSTKIITDWKFIVGESLALKTLPWKLSYDKYDNNGSIHVYVKDSPTALEISYLEQLILEKIATYFGYRAICKLKMKQNPQIFANVKQEEEFEIKDLLNESEKSKIRTELEQINNKELESALFKMAVSMKSRKKAECQ